MNQIYAAGAITGLKWDEHFIWRDEMAATIGACTHHKWNVFNPSLHISDIEELNMSDREAMDYDLYHLLRSDLVVVNFSKKADSLGTAAELGAAYTHQIPIVGLNETGEELHPWQRDMCLVVFDKYNMMINYLVNHFLNEK